MFHNFVDESVRDRNSHHWLKKSFETCGGNYCQLNDCKSKSIVDIACKWLASYYYFDNSKRKNIRKAVFFKKPKTLKSPISLFLGPPRFCAFFFFLIGLTPEVGLPEILNEYQGRPQAELVGNSFQLAIDEPA